MPSAVAIAIRIARAALNLRRVTRDGGTQREIPLCQRANDTHCACALLWRRATMLFRGKTAPRARSVQLWTATGGGKSQLLVPSETFQQTTVFGTIDVARKSRHSRVPRPFLIAQNVSPDWRLFWKLVNV